MRKTIRFINMTTNRTGTTGVPRINQEHWYAHPFRFIGHERSKLVERPIMQGCPLSATNRNPRAYPFQVFQDNCSICVFRLGNQLFANAVIGIFGKAVFLPRQPLKFPFCRPRTFGLQLGPQASLAMANVVNVISRVYLTIAINGDIGDSQINSQRVVHVNWLRFIHFASSGKVEYSFGKSQVTFSLSRLKQFKLLFSINKWNAKSPTHCPNRHSLVLQAPGQNAIIVCDAACHCDSAFVFTVELVSISNFANRSNRHLSRKIEMFSYYMIALVMQVVLAEGLRFPGSITHKLASSIGLFQSAHERISLFRSREQFDLGNQLHITNYNTNVLLSIFFHLTLLNMSNKEDGLHYYVIC